MAFGNTDINCCKQESTVRRCGEDAMVVCDGEELNMILDIVSGCMVRGVLTVLYRLGLYRAEFN